MLYSQNIKINNIEYQFLQIQHDHAQHLKE